MMTTAVISVFVTLTLALFVLDPASAYPTYVPDKACGDMRPLHSVNKSYTGDLIEPMWDGHDFWLVLGADTIAPGGGVDVTIYTYNYDYDKNYFQGFLLQAHRVGSNIWDPEDPPELYGEFYSYMDDTQLACGTKAISHSVSKHYEYATFYWIAPEVWSPEEFQFVATIVKDYDHFYMDIRSETIWVMAPTSVPVAAADLVSPMGLGLTLLVTMTTALFVK